MAFGGSTLAAFLVLALAALFGTLQEPLPLWLYLATILGVDVSHVHATFFRTYLDSSEFRRRRTLYTVVPMGCYLAGFFAYQVSPAFFWTALAYLAAFHFVRQPYGWVALYRVKNRESALLDRYLDTFTIYATTLYPLLWWHAYLPRNFDWFLAGDFLGPSFRSWIPVATACYYILLITYSLRQFQRWFTERIFCSGKNLIVTSTAITWYVGIVAINSDLAFTVTNVLPHGIPYLVLIWFYGKRDRNPQIRGISARVWSVGPWLFMLLLLCIAYLEESVWDRLVWHDHAQLFGSGLPANSWHFLIVPLLALPQFTHYVLDGFIWKRRTNPSLSS